MNFYHSVLVNLNLIYGEEELRKMKKINVIWAISLFVIGVVAVVLAGANIIGIDLPDITIRVLGLCDLVSLPLLVYTTVKKVKGKEN